MSKVFRFHQGSVLKDWQISSPLNETNINAIKDPDGASVHKQITSIPSPFARIDLVRTAFKTISSSKELDGNTMYHKLISDAFDIGQVFFDFEKYSDKISIIAWDKATDLNLLINSNNSSHRILGETLRLYLEQDADVYNFNDLKRIFLLHDKTGNKPLNIIGGTSPISLFFTSANNLEYTNLQDGNDKFFDQSFCPLYKRSKEFIQFVFSLKNTIPDFSSKFSYVNDYLDLTYSKLDIDFREKLSHSNLKSWYSNLKDLCVNDDHNIVEILGCALKKKSNSTDYIEENSDFTILPSVNNFEGKKPLVLPNEIFSEKLLYTIDFWDLNYKAPFEDKNSLNERRLPLINDKYPYITISDFIEPVLIRTLLPINEQFFFNGNNEKNENGFLLPIKPLFFNYFTINDLQRKHLDGNLFFEMKTLSNKSIEVILRVPIRNQKYITFKRLYNNPISNATLPSANEGINSGAIIENVFTVGIFPFLKFPPYIKADYRVALYEADYLPITEQNEYRLSFYNIENQIISDVKSKSRRIKSNEGVSSETYILQENFEFLQLKNNFGQGILIPRFDESKGNDQFSVSIDFGTSNTHIEYRVGNSLPKPLEINSTEVQFGLMHPFGNSSLLEKANLPYLNYILEFLNGDFIPQLLGKDNEFSFPTRTVVYHDKNLSFDKTVYSFADISIPFTYEKLPHSPSLKATTNIKWSNRSLENDKIIDVYFEKLLLIIRAKILLNNGDLSLTKIVWFYPSSMSVHQQNAIEEKWMKNTEKIFGKSVVPVKICESLAPLYYYSSVGNISPGLVKPVVSIDTGGGTTDIVVYEKNSPKILSSFKFAGNSIFGDEYSRSYLMNGFIQKYYHKYIELLDVNNSRKLKETLQQIMEKGVSTDIINALFSLEENRDLKKQNLEISFLNDLKKDSDFKIIFLVFFSSIIYHIAQLMKSRNLDSPESIIFSGTASKLITILDSTPRSNTLNILVNKLFSKFYDSPNVKIYMPSNPKEITCKGGLYIDSSNVIDPETIKYVYCSQKVYTSEDIIPYGQIDPSFEEKSMFETTDFIEYLFNLNNEFSFNNNFGITNDVIAFSKDFILSNSKNAIRQGMLSKQKELGSSYDIEKLTETLFFYPLIGTLGSLTYEINQSFNSIDNEE